MRHLFIILSLLITAATSQECEYENENPDTPVEVERHSYYLAKQMYALDISHDGHVFDCF